MKTLRPFLTIVCVLLATLAKADEKPSPAKVAAETRRAALWALLEKGRAAQAWPEGMTVRLEADLFGHKRGAPKASEAASEKHFIETWEFTRKEVHRVAVESGNKESRYRRIESRPFDSSLLCEQLLEGKVREISARKGTGEEVMFAGTDYSMGGRSIEILQDGKVVLGLTEYCAVAGFRKTDSLAFAALYETLATQARGAFATEPAKAP